MLRNYILRFPVPVPTFDKFRFRFRLWIKTLKKQFSPKICKISCLFNVNRSSIAAWSSVSRRTLWFHFITVPVPLRQKVTVLTVPVPQHCVIHCVLSFLSTAVLSFHVHTSCSYLKSYFTVAIKLHNHICYRKSQDHLIFGSLFSRSGAAACLLGWHERGGAPHSGLAQAQDDPQLCLRIGRLRSQARDHTILKIYIQ